MANIAVVGGGIGGLSVANLLQKSGYNFTVFEQAPKFSPIGAGINFSSNGTRVLRAMGFGERMHQVGILHRTRSVREWDTGEPFRTFDMAALGKKYGSDFLAFHRADLHDMLVSTISSEKCKLGKRLEGLSSYGSTVHLHFADGTEEVFDAVIGADGLRSVVRPHVLGPAPLKYFGHVLYRTLIATEKLEGKLLLEDYIKWWGPDGRYVLMYYMRGDRNEYNVAAVAPERLSNEELVPMPVSPTNMLEKFQGFHKDAQVVLENFTEVSRWPMLVRAPQQPWSKGRVTMLGDAAHPMTPHLGQGGVTAIEDAVMLVRCLDAFDGRDFEAAFQLYERNRFERVAGAQSDSQSNKIGSGDSDVEWLYGYDVATVPLA